MLRRPAWQSTCLSLSGVFQASCGGVSHEDWQANEIGIGGDSRGEHLRLGCGPPRADGYHERQRTQSKNSRRAGLSGPSTPHERSGQGQAGSCDYAGRAGEEHAGARWPSPAGAILPGCDQGLEICGSAGRDHAGCGVRLSRTAAVTGRLIRDLRSGWRTRAGKDLGSAAAGTPEDQVSGGFLR